jgi:hypothetical protein
MFRRALGFAHSRKHQKRGISWAAHQLLGPTFSRTTPHESVSSVLYLVRNMERIINQVLKNIVISRRYVLISSVAGKCTCSTIYGKLRFSGYNYAYYPKIPSYNRDWWFRLFCKTGHRPHIEGSGSAELTRNLWRWAVLSPVSYASAVHSLTFCNVMKDLTTSASRLTYRNILRDRTVFYLCKT